ncbi:FAD-dependent oxidoreductase [Kiritimatiella glycovorans]|uniref:Pyridine nucleotide-disulfide oxidoreductase n=1 Tax=Kiritimatiella glycovorans TaxID=1307763 RepID=A0A0G3EE40_9BACT|nr:FAD-dependent oxidoreductase [Kiritimatiella glycovorans]AKJ64583.1 Pyridine nucleotide-disulfide oxidoreductase [Kiritimatiella glycovorans]
MTNRRDFVKTGVLTVSLLNRDLAFSFVPDDFYDSGAYDNAIPFRKPARTIREVVPGFLWADAADFGSYGGWALDTQHSGFMGSSYLIAHGAGTPVEDAGLTIPDVRPGRYRLWVRSRNWIPEHSPGRFAVRINGQDSGIEYGAQGEKGWSWQDGGLHELQGGTVEMTLRDLTGYYGRCSSIILTRDTDYRPPADLEAFRRERARLSGESDQLQRRPEYDVVVVGAGTAGCCAAIAAARLGMKTALISDRPVLGGNASVEIGVPVQGAASQHRFARESGIIEEAGRIGLVNEWGSIMSRPFATLIEKEKNLEVYEDTRVEAVEKSGTKRIRAALARHTLTGGRSRIPGKMFIDTSGDGWLGYYAGADHRVGREPRSMYNESYAPERADNITMSGCLRGPREEYKRCLFYRTVRESSPQKFETPPWIYRLPPDWINRRGDDQRLERVAWHGTWWLEHHGEVDDLWDPEYARDALLRINFTFWDYMKNKWSERSRLSKHRLDYVPFMVGKRETRRLLGDYVLNQNDCESARPFEDAIGHTGWPLDVHAAEGLFSTTGPYDCAVKIPIAQIPYRTLYSRNIENLLMAGRAMSVSHIALGTVRVEGQTSITGQAAGTAAALALHRRTTPRGVYRRHMDELQQLLLKHDQYIPGVRNRDPEDLALRAEVRASSQFVDASNPFRREMESSERGRWFELNMARGVFFPWEAGRRLERISLPLEAKRDAEITLHLRAAGSGNDLSSATDVATVTRRISAGMKGWVDFPIDREIPTAHAWMYLETAEGVSWRHSSLNTEGVFRFYGRPGVWQKVQGDAMTFALDPDPVFTERRVYAPVNVINGTARPTEEAPNMWISDAGEPLPQWIELTLERRAKVSSVHCVFDTDLSVTMGKQRDAHPDVCVRDYTIECRTNGKWKNVARIRGNYQRFRRHEFPACVADKVRLTVESTHGAPQARVMEIRVYGA